MSARRARIIECVGLPGAGKSTLCGLVETPHRRRGEASRLPRLDRRTCAAARAVIALALTVRPFRPANIARALRFAYYLRHYGPGGTRPVLLDLGLIQRLWSLLMQSNGFSEAKLHAALVALAPLAADDVVWVRLPLHEAVARMTGRPRGRSRFDGLDQALAEQRLEPEARLLDRLIGQARAIWPSRFVELDAMAPEAINVERLEDLLQAA